MVFLVILWFSYALWQSANLSQIFDEWEIIAYLCNLWSCIFLDSRYRGLCVFNIISPDIPSLTTHQPQISMNLNLTLFSPIIFYSFSSNDQCKTSLQNRSAVIATSISKCMFRHLGLNASIRKCINNKKNYFTWYFYEQQYKH